MRDTSQDNMIYYTLAAIRRLFQANKKKPATITKKRPGNSKKSQKNALSEAAYRKLFRKAEKASKAREWQQAAKLWQVVLDTQDLQATLKPYLKLSQALRKQGYTREAEDLMQKAAANFGELPAVTKEFAEIAMTRGDWEQAVKHWEKLRNADEKEKISLRVFIGLANALRNMYKHDQSIHVLDHAESYFDYKHERITHAKATTHLQNAVWNTFKVISDNPRTEMLSNDWNAARKNLDHYCAMFPKANHAYRMKRFSMYSRLSLNNIYLANLQYNSSTSILEDYFANFRENRPGALDGLRKYLLPRLSNALHRQHHPEPHALETRTEVTEYIRTLDKEMLSFESWLDLHTLLWDSGFIVSSGLARKKGVDRLYTDMDGGKSDHDKFFYALLASLDQGDINFAGHCLERLRKTKTNASQYEEIKAYLSLLQGKRSEADTFYQKKFNWDDRCFLDYVCGKKLAIIGNAQPSTATDEELSSFDYVVKLDSPLNKDYSMAGKKGSIISIGNTFEKNIHIKEYLNSASHIDWVSLPRNSINYRRFKQEGFNTRLRQATLKLFNGHLNHGMLTFYDMILFKPDYVKLFNMNFYLLKKLYYSNDIVRSKKEAATNLVILLSQARHDSLSQINFTRNFYNAGYIDADSDCAAVLNMSEEDFLIKMERKVLELQEIVPNPWNVFYYEHRLS